ncbi:acyl-CoA oxidase [Streptomyces sp. BK208]|uniref:acyl-CoA oxidase n=1 Tax=Streptomyces sp. BK208 TaxID=2512150 RepID=UPI00105C33EF|nr:acyl-CoA oxidase [Streptomyces sp. BK208]TDT25916.1 acyl-CoA oxidase [Streptomyces sp. BK208]
MPDRSSALHRLMFGDRWEKVHEPWRRFYDQEDLYEPVPPDEQLRRAYALMEHVPVDEPERFVQDTERLMALHEWATCGSLATVAGIHYNLFLGTLVDAGRDIGAFRGQIGTFLCTEVEHGNGAAFMETTATWNGHGFDLHTPHAGAAKFMPNTGLLGGPKTAVVFARLQMRERDEGVFGFVVPLHDGHRFHPGVQVQPLPWKVGPAVDHCLTRFDHVRLPPDALVEGEHGRLDGATLVSETGAPHRFLKAIRRVENGKLCMMGVATGGARQSLGLSVQYAKERRTRFVAAEDWPLWRIRSHSDRLLEAIADTCVASAWTRTLVDIPADPLTLLAKGWITWRMRQAMLEARERCGAQALFPANLITERLLFNEGAITAEGDNLAIWAKAGPLLLAQEQEPPGGEGVEEIPALAEALTRTSLETAIKEDGGRNQAGPLMDYLNVRAMREAVRCFRPQDETTELLLRLFLVKEAVPWVGRLLAEGRIDRSAARRLPKLRAEALDALHGRSEDLVAAFRLPEGMARHVPMLHRTS